MKGESLIGFSASVLVHLCLLAAVFGLSTAPLKEHKVISLDFTLLDGGVPAKGAGGGAASASASKRTVGAGPSMAPLKTAAARPVESEPLSAPPVAVSEPDGPVALPGQPYSGGTDAGAGSGVLQGASGAGSGQPGKSSGKGGSPAGIDFGKGGSGLSGFTFIRHDILKNIRYPERARRMRWEGRVLLSFSILEDGSVRNVVVATSSGFPVLDESAREAVKGTTFSRKITQRLDVVLPVEYKLQ